MEKKGVFVVCECVFTVNERATFWASTLLITHSVCRGRTLSLENKHNADLFLLLACTHTHFSHYMVSWAHTHKRTHIHSFPPTQKLPKVITALGKWRCRRLGEWGNLICYQRGVGRLLWGYKTGLATDGEEMLMSVHSSVFICKKTTKCVF